MELDPTVGLLPSILSTLRAFRMEPVESVADRVAGITAISNRRDVGWMMAAATSAAQRQQASSLQQLISMSSAVDPMDRTTVIAVTASLPVILARKS
jgi:hypothetical protein